MNIYGLVGYTLLEKDNKNILIFADIHDGVTYCNNSEGISDWLKGRINNNQILVEEVQLKNVNLKDLWPNSKHTQELKSLVKNYNSNVDAVDIRPILIPFSWELLDKYPKLGNISIRNYLLFLDNFFEGKGVLYNTIISNEVNKLKDNKYYKKILIHYIIVKDEFYSLKRKMNLDKKIIYYFKKKNQLENINHLISLVMEWYIVLLSLNSSKNTIIHSGLAHTTRLNNILEKFYDFKIVDKKGLNYMKHLNYDKVYSACVIIPEHIKSRFNKKFGFF
jgi:hypothetical protein